MPSFQFLVQLTTWQLFNLFGMVVERRADPLGTASKPLRWITTVSATKQLPVKDVSLIPPINAGRDCQTRGCSHWRVRRAITRICTSALGNGPRRHLGVAGSKLREHVSPKAIPETDSRCARWPCPRKQPTSYDAMLSFPRDRTRERARGLARKIVTGNPQPLHKCV
jgi:hypothetical protein